MPAGENSRNRLSIRVLAKLVTLLQLLVIDKNQVMSKVALVAFFCCCISWKGLSQVLPGQVEIAKLPAPSWHYQEEYAFDTVINAAAWDKIGAGLHVSFASTDKLYFRRELPVIDETNAWKAAGWKGERLNTVILLWSRDTVEQVRLQLSDLKNKAGALISRKNGQLQKVNYVISNYPYGARNTGCGESPNKDVYLMPDRFEHFDRFDIPAQTVRPIWLSIDIPEATTAGDYTGTITVGSEKNTTTLQFTITVQNQVLPKPTAWKHRLDLWQNPWVVAWRNNVKPWSADHKLLLKNHLKLYADAGGKYITTYAVHSPWSDNSYMIEGGMIDWIKTKSGGWKFDYNIFDQYVQLAMECGIDKAITVYTPIPWGNRFRYLDESTGNYVSLSLAPETSEFKSFWNVFLTDLQKHLTQKGWLEKTYLGINENEMKQTLAAIKVIKAHSAKWKITYAGDWHAELDNLLDDYCFVYGKESDLDVVKKRAAKGFTTTYYVCCTPPVPNNFVFSPPIEGRWISWYTAAHGYDGFLRWAYDAWPADPARDARHTLWPAGDCFLVYPGGNSCIRFEKLREGIVDFEKIRILREKASKSTNAQVQLLLSQLDEHLKIYLAEKEFNSEKITADIEKGRSILGQLSEWLGQ